MKNTLGTEGGKTPFCPLGNQYHRRPNTPAKRAVWAYKAKKGGILIIKPNRSLTEQIFGIGRYRYSKDGQLYFIHGRTRIKVTEHFSADGKPLNTLLEDVIQFSAQRRDDEIRPTC